jgi:hypothetical protein
MLALLLLLRLMLMCGVILTVRQQRMEQELDGNKVNAMHGEGLRMRLALAVAEVWLGGVLKSSTARCLCRWKWLTN